MAATMAAQQPTFRAAVDLVVVDVQVVDNTGRPVPSLVANDFEVSIAGKRRRVVSADFIRSASLETAAAGADERDGRPEAGPAVPQANGAVGASREFVLAFDTDSFGVEQSRDVVAAARAFIARLLPADSIGLYTFPVGPRLEPTTDHAAIGRLVNTIVGHSQSMVGEYNLSPSEIVDITAEASRDAARANERQPVTRGNPISASSQVVAPESVLQRVQIRECGALETSCGDAIRAEANSKAFYLEGRASEGLNGLRALIQLLGEQPGRKTVILFSAGIPASDRPGGRPDVGDLAKLLGQDAAATNTSIYTLLVDTKGFQNNTAEARRGSRLSASMGREGAVTGRLLEEFSGASGGGIIRVLMGGGGLALDRVLRETSAHYLLGIEPSEPDRDGKLRELRVKVSEPGVTVRSRSWVVVPKKKV
jgi:VWFA-related protein